jgi:selenocysteine lyase/cysteine desulfurase
MWFIRPIHRASFGLYNTVAEVDMLVDALEKAKAMF